MSSMKKLHEVISIVTVRSVMIFWPINTNNGQLIAACVKLVLL